MIMARRRLIALPLLGLAPARAEAPGRHVNHAADPAGFAPRFGGFCAYGVAQGCKVDIDPEAWQIVAGRLCLNCSREVHRPWSRDIRGHLAAAEANRAALAHG
jgi:hypothetical protein